MPYWRWKCYKQFFVSKLSVKTALVTSLQLPKIQSWGKSPLETPVSQELPLSGLWIPKGHVQSAFPNDILQNQTPSGTIWRPCSWFLPFRLVHLLTGICHYGQGAPFGFSVTSDSNQGFGRSGSKTKHSCGHLPGSLLPIIYKSWWKYGSQY